MKYLRELQQKKIFSLKDVTRLTGNVSTAKSLMQSYKKAGYITSIRRNMYATLDLASGAVMANRYEIASQAAESAYISYHSALEYHGLANQVVYEMSISSDSNIRRFTFDGITYNVYKSRTYKGVISAAYNSLIRVTNPERTVVDCIHNIDLAGGLEELLQCIELIPQLDAELLLEYLRLYDEKYLWQKAGYILESFASQFHLEHAFFEECERSIGRRKNYLGDSTDFQYSGRWRLYIPVEVSGELSTGGEDLV